MPGHMPSGFEMLGRNFEINDAKQIRGKLTIHAYCDVIMIPTVV